MPRKCLVCTHPKRAYINKALMNPKQSMRNIAVRIGVSRSTLQRHKAYIKRASVKARENDENGTGQTALQRITAMLEEAEARYREAEGFQQVAWFREWRSMLELGFKLGMEAQKEKQVFNDVTPAIKALIDVEFDVDET